MFLGSPTLYGSSLEYNLAEILGTYASILGFFNKFAEDFFAELIPELNRDGCLVGKVSENTFSLPLIFY